MCPIDFKISAIIPDSVIAIIKLHIIRIYMTFTSPMATIVAKPRITPKDTLPFFAETIADDFGS